MECFVECLSCHQEVGSDEDAVMCGDCKWWQHWSCAKGVDPSFFSKFYLAVVQEQKPVHWQCHFCTEKQTVINHDKPHNPELDQILSNLPHPVEGCISDSDSEDELSTLSYESFHLTRTGREELALDPRPTVHFSSSSSDSSSDNLDVPTLCDYDDQDIEVDLDLPPSQSDTILACDSSDSEDEKPLETPAITYSITEGTASGARSKLTDSLGYIYQIKFKLGAQMFWACTEKVRRCSATIIQHRQNQFTRGAASHNHQSSQSQTSTRTNPSKVAKKGRSTITAEPITVAPADNVTTTGSQPRPTNPTGQSNITLQEITTCVQRGSYMNRSVVIDSEGFIYDYKKVEDQAQTIWRCTHNGPNGMCQGQVSLNYMLEFNLDTLFAVFGNFIWVHHHNNEEEGKHITGTEPHNHEADWTAAVMLKLKAMIHKQIHSKYQFNAFPRVIIKAATAKLDEHERVHVPQDQKHISRLRGFINRQQKIAKSLTYQYRKTYMYSDSDSYSD